MAAWVRRKDKKGVFAFIAFQEYKEDEYLRKQFEDAFHVRKPNGEYLRAGRASLFVLEKLGWNWWAKILTYPPLIWLVEFGYRIVANNRNFLARFIFRRENT